MTFISRKNIKDRKRYYLEKSVRMIGGKVKKMSIYLKSYNPKKKYDTGQYKKILDSKIEREIIDYSKRYYKKSIVFNEQVLGRLEEIKHSYKKITEKITPKQLSDIIDRFTVNFTYESNAIEGNSLTLKDVAMILHEKKILKGKDLREIYEAINTREAMESVLNKRLKINEKDIIKLHRILVKNTGVAFGYKKLPNFILGRNVNTAPPEKVGQEMKNLINWYYKDTHMHPLERASIFHGRFEKIHPFDDGNGRVGRLLINVMLLNNGYPPLIIRKTHRISYFGSLEAFDKSYEDKLSRFLIEKYKNTYEKFFEVYVKYLK